MLIYLNKENTTLLKLKKKTCQLLKKQLSWKLGRRGNHSNLRSEYESKLFKNVVLIPEVERQMMVVKRMGHFSGWE